MTAAPPPAEKSVARLILILSISAFASTSAGRIVEPMVGVIARDLSAAPTTIALLATVFALPYAFCQPIFGPIGDSFGKERLMPICLGVLAVTLATSAFAPTSEALFLLRLISGGAAGGVIPLALAMIGDRVEMAGRQVAISRFLIAVIFGQLAGSTVAGLLAESLGWRGVFLLSATLTGVTAVAAGLGFGAPARRQPFDLRAAFARYRTIAGIPRARALFAFVFIDAIVFLSVLPYVAPTLEARREGGPFEAGLVIAGFAAGGLVYSALVRWMLRRLGLSGMLIGSGLFAAAAHLVLAGGFSWKVDLAAMLALGLAFYTIHSSYQTQVTELAPESRASAVALHAFCFFTGQAAGVALIGLGLRGLGWAPTLLLCAVVVVALGAASAMVLPKPFADQPRAR